jgi:low affinity Fe/Cu permease
MPAPISYGRARFRRTTGKLAGVGCGREAPFDAASRSRYRGIISRSDGEGEMINRMFEQVAAKVAASTGRPSAFMLALAVIVVWAVTGPLFHWSDTWQLVINTGTTIVTFLMVFLIQNAQNRDASAIQAKLDELIRAATDARNEFIGIEHLSEAELLGLIQSLERICGGEAAHQKAIERLIERR